MEAARETLRSRILVQAGHMTDRRTHACKPPLGSGIELAISDDEIVVAGSMGILEDQGRMIMLDEPASDVLYEGSRHRATADGATAGDIAQQRASSGNQHASMIDGGQRFARFRQRSPCGDDDLESRLASSLDCSDASMRDRSIAAQERAIEIDDQHVVAAGHGSR